jgi:hypothetical protein
MKTLRHRFTMATAIQRKEATEKEITKGKI